MKKPPVRPPQRPPKTDITRDEQIAELWATGKFTLTELGRVYGITRQRVAQILERVGR